MTLLRHCRRHARWRTRRWWVCITIHDDLNSIHSSLHLYPSRVHARPLWRMSSRAPGVHLFHMHPVATQGAAMLSFLHTIA